MSQIPTFNLAHTTEGNYAIQQGITFQGISFYYKNVDLTDYKVTGQIRSNYASSQGTVLANFEFDPLVFGTVTIGDYDSFEATIVTPKLTDEITAKIPATVPMETLIAGISGWTYDIKLESPTGASIIVVMGLVQVIPDVTRPYVPGQPTIGNPSPTNPTNPALPPNGTVEASHVVVAPIKAYQLVALTSNGIVPASSLDISQSGSIIGIALSKGAIGDTIKVATQGQVIYSGWSFVRNSTVYLGAIPGEVVQQPDELGLFSQSIGVATRPNTVNISIVN